MLRITNIRITERAAVALDVAKVNFRPRQPGEVFALDYMVSFTNPDGTTVAGFRPGYTVSSWQLDGRLSNDALVHHKSGLEFYFTPRFAWRSDRTCVVDLVSELYELFSIEPAT